jgi:hypothetical protein
LYEKSGESLFLKTADRVITTAKMGKAIAPIFDCRCWHACPGYVFEDFRHG